MNKTYKKSDIDKYLSKAKNNIIKEEEITELLNYNGTLVNKDDNFKASTRIVRSKKTTDDFVRSATQGPEAYFIYGGPYYGINYTYTVSEGEEVLEEDSVEENTSPELKQDLEAFHGDDFLEIVDEGQIGEMKNLVDEIIRKKKDNRGIVKKYTEHDILQDGGVQIPDISELKKVYEKPMVTRKADHLIDLIHKEGLTGDELAIILNHIIDNIEINKLSDEYREYIGDKIKYDKDKE